MLFLPCRVYRLGQQDLQNRDEPPENRVQKQDADCKCFTARVRGSRRVVAQPAMLKASAGKNAFPAHCLGKSPVLVCGRIVVQGREKFYEGDAIIAFWNGPLSQDDHAARCREVLENLPLASWDEMWRMGSK